MLFASELRGRRFGVVVQSDAFLPRSVVLVAPTSRSAKPASFRPEVEINGARTRILVEQVGAVDVNRLGDIAGHCTPEEQWGIDAALLTVLGLNWWVPIADPGVGQTRSSVRCCCFRSLRQRATRSLPNRSPSTTRPTRRSSSFEASASPCRRKSGMAAQSRTDRSVWIRILKPASRTLP